MIINNDITSKAHYLQVVNNKTVKSYFNNKCQPHKDSKTEGTSVLFQVNLKGQWVI